MKRLLVLMGVLGITASFVILLFARNRAHSPAHAEDYAHLPKPAQPPALWPTPDFAFRDQRGLTVTKASLGGQPYVANFIFTTCRTVCPLLTTKMVRLQRELPGLPVHFVSFSVDPEHDSVEALAAYARAWNPSEERWLLLETAPPTLAQLAGGFHVAAQRTDAGLDPVLHSSVFVLVDERGVVRGVFDSESADDFSALTRALQTLVGSTARAPAASPRSGEVLFHELSCANCHLRPELAPELGGLLGQRRELDNGLLVTADEAYFKESILMPQAKRVAGFPLKMPAYAGHVSSQELENLVKYVGSLPRPSAPTGEAALAIDPVCHMKVRLTGEPFRAHNDAGHEAYFCSEWCRARFLENPDAYRP